MFDGDSNDVQFLVPETAAHPDTPMTCVVYHHALAGAYSYAAREANVVCDVRWPITRISSGAAWNTLAAIQNASLTTVWYGWRYIPDHAEALHIAMNVIGRGSPEAIINVEVDIDGAAKTLTAPAAEVVEGPALIRGYVELSGLTRGQRLDFDIQASSVDANGAEVAVTLERILMWWGEAV